MVIKFFFIDWFAFHFNYSLPLSYLYFFIPPTTSFVN